jgi:hypothetical protein
MSAAPLPPVAADLIPWVLGLPIPALDSSFKPLLFTPIYFYPTFATAGAVSRIFEFLEFFEFFGKPGATVFFWLLYCP